MNDDRSLERAARSWLEDGPTQAPDRAVEAALLRIETTSQERDLRIPWRLPKMTTPARVATAAVIGVLAVGGAFLFLGRPGQAVVGGPGPSTTPASAVAPTVVQTASPTPLATVAQPSPSPSILAGDVVYPGTYVPKFDPPMTFTIDKEVEHNCAPGFRCRGSINVNLPGWLDIEFGQPKIEAMIFRLDQLNDPARPGRLIDPPADLAAWIASRPGLTVTAQKAVTVGGLAATQLDVRTGNKDIGFGPIPGVTDPGFGLPPNWVGRLYVVPVHGRQVVISLHAEDGSIDELQPLVDSIVWR